MSKFGSSLANMMASHKVTGIALAEASNVDSATISRLKKGELLPNEQDLASLIAVLGKNRVQQAELLRAYLLDHCTGPAADMIDIEIRGKPRALRETAEDVPLRPGVEQSLLELKNAAQSDKDLADLLNYLAKLYKKGHAEDKGKK